MGVRGREEIKQNLITLAGRYEQEVLKAFGFHSNDPRSLPSSHPYWKLRHSIAQRRSRQIARLLSDPRDEWEELDKRTHVCVRIQDWLNEYTRECLSHHGFIRESYGTIDLNHPFYQARWDLLKNM